MSEDFPRSNRQDGVDITPPDGAERGQIATGDRREERHYEPDPDQLVVVRSGVQPTGPIPPEEQSAAVDHDELGGEATMADLRVDPSTSSVWDARPPADDETRSGNPTDH